MATSSTRATQLLDAARRGESAAVVELLPLVYDRLRAVASGLLARERSGHTLQPTALVHEVWMDLIDVGSIEAGDTEGARRQFVSLAARQMRRVLVDHARAAKRCKRGGAMQRVELPVDLPVRDLDVATLLDLEAAMEALHARSERLGRIAELRLFGGLGTVEIAALLGVARSTVADLWALARAMLSRSLGGGE